MKYRFNMTKDLYKKIGELTSEMEGEMLQNLYFFFLEYPLDEKRCEKVPAGYKSVGSLIPRVEDCFEMKDALKKIFDERHQVFISKDLYREDLF